MTAPRSHSATLVALVVALTSSVSTLALAQSQDASRTLGNNDSLLIDGRTFNVTPGASKGDVSAQITKLGAHEIGAGAIIFRSGDKLYIADSVAMSPTAQLIYNPDIERQRAYGMWDSNVDCSRAASERDPSCLPVATLRDQDYPRQQSQLDYERQRPLGLRDQYNARQQQSQLDYERQRPLGLRDQDNTRQQQSQLDYERQRPLGLRDQDNARQQQSQLDYERQRPLGLRDQDNTRQQQSQLDYERQRPLGLRDQDNTRQQQSQLDYERQRPLGLRDQGNTRQQQAQLDYERQRPLGLRDAEAGPARVYINDPDYSYYKLKKAFEDAWTPVQK